MGTMTLQDYRDYIYSWFDLEDEDLPTALIDTWVRDGQNRMERAHPRWKWLEVSTLILTEPGLYIYPLPSEYDLTEIREVSGPNGNLRWVGEGALLDIEKGAFANTTDGSHIDTPRGQPESFAISEQGGGFNLILWQPPAEVQPFIVLGARRVAPMKEAGDTTTFPREMDGVLLSWAMYKANEHEQDLESAQVCLADFNAGLAEFVNSMNMMPASLPIIFGGPKNKNFQGAQVPDRVGWNFY